MIELEKEYRLQEKDYQKPNLSDRFTERDLTTIGGRVWDGYERDKWSRSRWEERNEAGMNLALQLQEAKTFPWANCSNVAFPLVTIAAMQFHARAYPAIISGTDIVKCRVIGADPDGQESARAERISTHMSWQCYEQDQSWEEQHDRGLLNLAIVGSNFIKTYYNASEGYSTSELILAKDLVVDYWAKSIESAPRKTQHVPLTRNEIYEKVKRGIFHDVLKDAWFEGNAQVSPTPAQTAQNDRRGQTTPQTDELTPFLCLEQHVSMDLDCDGYAEPYIITIEAQNRAVLRIVCGWDRKEDVETDNKGDVIAISRTHYFTKYGLIPSPDGGIYDIGFGVLLGPLNESVNSAINQLFDAGTMSIAAGGFLARGAKIRGGTHAFAPFEWKGVESSGDDLRKSVFPLPVREPNSVLFQLLSLLIDYTNRVSGANDMMVGENPGQNTPASTAQEMVKQGSVIYSAIFKRIWRCMKEEFKKRYVLNAIYLPDTQTFGSSRSVIRQEDYLGNPNTVAPAADPNIASESQRLLQVQAVKSSSMQTPGYDIAAVERWYLKMLKVPDADVLYPGPDKVPQGEDVKVTIQKMKNEADQGWMQIEQANQTAQNALAYQQLMAHINEVQARLQLDAASVEGDEGDREIQRMNTYLGMMKEQGAAMKARLDVSMKAMDHLRSVQEARMAAQQVELDRREDQRKDRQENREDKKLLQKDKELEIKEKVANKPAAGAK